MRHDLYERLQQLPMSFHSKWQSGQLLSRATTDLSAIRRFSGFGLLFLVINILQVTAVTVVLLHMYWPLGLVVAAAAGADRVALDALREGLRRAVPRGCRTSRATWPPAPRRARSASAYQVLRPQRPRAPAVRRAAPASCTPPAWRRSGSRRGSGPSSR